MGASVFTKLLLLTSELPEILPYFSEFCGNQSSMKTFSYIQHASCSNHFIDTCPIEKRLNWSASCTSCAQEHELPQSQCGDKREDTLFSWLHIYYAHLAFVRFELSVCRGSLITNFMCHFIHVYMYHLIHFIQTKAYFNVCDSLRSINLPVVSKT